MSAPPPPQPHSPERTPLVFPTAIPALSSPSPVASPSSSRRCYPHSLSLFLPLLLLLSLIVFVNSSPPPIYRISPSTPSSTRASTTSELLRVFSLNAYILPSIPGVIPYRAARLSALMPRLRSVDLLCMQEFYWVSGPFKSRFLKSASSRLGLAYIAATPALGWRGLFQWPPKLVDAGLIIASRHPIIKADYYIYQATNILTIDFLAAKSVMYARVQTSLTDARPVHVFTTHLQAANGLPLDFATVRRQQLHELVTYVHKCTADDDDPVIVLCGDFNVDGRQGYSSANSSAEYLSMMNILNGIGRDVKVRDVLFNAYGSHPVTTAGGLNGTTQKNERLDYIFLAARSTRDIAAVKDSVFVNKLLAKPGAPYRTISDHYAVQATVNVSIKDPKN